MHVGATDEKERFGMLKPSTGQSGQDGHPGRSASVLNRDSVFRR